MSWRRSIGVVSGSILAFAILLLGFLTLRVTRQPPVPRESDEPAEPNAEPPERGEPREF